MRVFTVDYECVSVTRRRLEIHSAKDEAEAVQAADAYVSGKAPIRGSAAFVSDDYEVPEFDERLESNRLLIETLTEAEETQMELPLGKRGVGTFGGLPTPEGDNE